jgi:hypothetical protein
MKGCYFRLKEIRKHHFNAEGRENMLMVMMSMMKVYNPSAITRLMVGLDNRISNKESIECIHSCMSCAVSVSGPCCAVIVVVLLLLSWLMASHCLLGLR